MVKSNRFLVEYFGGAEKLTMNRAVASLAGLRRGIDRGAAAPLQLLYRVPGWSTGPLHPAPGAAARPRPLLHRHRRPSHGCGAATLKPTQLLLIELFGHSVVGAHLAHHLAPRPVAGHAAMPHPVISLSGGHPRLRHGA